MRMHLATALVAALVVTTPPAASAESTQPGPAWSTPRTYTGTIVRIDASDRTVTTRNALGVVSVWEPPASMPSSELAGFAPGETVMVTFYDGFEVRPRTAGAAPVTTSVDPGTGLRTATVTVSAVDLARRTLVFIGPRGRYTRTMADGADTSALNMLRLGASIDVSYFE